jgi:FtsZ-binding cell division protein ZapB
MMGLKPYGKAMPERSKVTSYLPKSLYDAIGQYAKQERLSLSAATERILQLGISTLNPSSSSFKASPVSKQLNREAISQAQEAMLSSQNEQYEQRLRYLETKIKEVEQISLTTLKIVNDMPRFVSR